VSTKTIHILFHGRALCGFSCCKPLGWTNGNVWVSVEESNNANCTSCLSLVEQLRKRVATLNSVRQGKEQTEGEVRGTKKKQKA
jgi:hypothetical protein